MSQWVYLPFDVFHEDTTSHMQHPNWGTKQSLHFASFTFTFSSPLQFRSDPQNIHTDYTIGNQLSKSSFNFVPF